MPQFVCNGTLLKKEVAQKLQEENVLFGVSIDGKKKEHDMNRVTRDGKGTFDSIIKNIKGIKHRDYVGAALTVSNDNLHFLEGFKFLSKYFNTVSVKIIRPEINEHLKVSEIKEEYHQLVNYLLDEMNKGKPESLLRLLNGDDFFLVSLLVFYLTKGSFIDVMPALGNLH